MTDEGKLIQLGDPSGRQTADYWNQWFEIVCKQEHRPFEWYCDVNQVARMLDYHIGRQGSREEAEPRMIHPGSGNSLVPVQLRDEFGFPHKQVVVDISDVALDEMRNVHDKNAKYEDQRHNPLEIEYDLGDVLQPPLKYDSNLFDVWLDKGLVDALFKDDQPTSCEQCRKLFQEANRLLVRENGVMVIITLAEDHSLHLMLDNWNQSWQPCVHVWDLTPISGEMRPFGFVFLKNKLDSPPSPSLCRSVVWHSENGATESIPAQDNAFEAVKPRLATSREEFRSQIAGELGSLSGVDVPLVLATLEIKPSDADVDLIVLGQKIAEIPWRSTVSDNNFANSRQLKPHWQPERRVVPIGYGIEKLLLQCIIKSEDLEDLLQAMREWSSNAEEIQSIDVDFDNTLRVKSCP